jgi:pantoate--beta-alanine ligase
MTTFYSADELFQYLDQQRKAGKLIGFVPTMGALHAGHLSLINTSCGLCDLTVASIFINPRQFNNREDYIRYPRDEARDARMLESAGCDVLFLPAEDEVYPSGYTPSDVPLGRLDQVLEGRHRPGHFRGVAEVVERLFRLVNPHVAFFGLKDYQQVKVVQHMVNHLGMDIRIVPCPIERERSGLAMSSRNRRFSDTGLMSASAIFRALNDTATRLKNGEPAASAIPLAVHKLQDDGVETEYLELCNPATLENMAAIAESEPAILLYAGYVEGVRLIDNLLINV